jgi:hypothetical protein
MSRFRLDASVSRVGGLRAAFFRYASSYINLKAHMWAYTAGSYRGDGNG